MKAPKSQFIPPAICVAALAYAAVVLTLFPKWTVDDAYISMRYAENLAHHGELNWNVGHDPIEGYTGVALPVILAGWIKLGGDPAVAAKLVGIGGFLLAALMAWLALGVIGAGRPVRAAAVAFHLSAPFMFTHAIGGLETQLFSAALMASLFALLLNMNVTKRYWVAEACFAATVLATSLIRPEGAALALAFGVALAWIRYQESRAALLRFATIFALIYLLPAIAYFVWRVGYYGQWLPNTFYAKTSGAGLNTQSLSSLGRFLYTYLTVPTLAAVALRASGWWRSGGAKRIWPPCPKCGAAIAATSLFLLVVALQYGRTTLVMNYSYRFFAPYFPLLLVGLAYLAHLGLEAWKVQETRKEVAPGALAAILILLAAAQATIYAVKLGDEFDFALEYKQVLEDQHLKAALYLRSTLAPSEWLIVYMDAGVIPYVSKLNAVDFGKLNDEKLSRGDLTADEAIDYFYSIDAAAVVFTSRDWDELDYTGEAEAIVNDPRFDRYRLVKRYRTSRTAIRQQYFEFVYLRRDLATQL